MRWPNQDYQQMCLTYGDPDIDDNGLPDAKWEAKNLIRIKPPYPMVMSWNQKTLGWITVHRHCGQSLFKILDRIGKEVSAAERERHQLNRYGGAYNFRLMRGYNKLSIHSWGAAIDLAPELNPLGKPWNPDELMMPEKVVQIFADEGWVWGGEWSRPDGMHFQAATV